MQSLRLLIPLRLAPDPILDTARRAAPSLLTMIRRGTAREDESSQAGICCAALGLKKQSDWPVAPLTARLDGLPSETGYWLRADPINLETGMGGLLLHPTQTLALTREETGQLLRDLNALWREAKLELLAPHPERWHLRLPAPPVLSTTPVDRVAGEYVTHHLPHGGDAGRLLRLVNEAQMLMHDHPVNQAREQRGLPVVNSIWLWGGGALPQETTRKLRVATDDAELRALAQATGQPWVPCPALWPDLARTIEEEQTLLSLSPGPDDTSLADFLQRLERDWLKPILNDLRLGRLRHVRVDLPGQPGRCADVGTLAAWRLWR